MFKGTLPSRDGAWHGGRRKIEARGRSRSHMVERPGGAFPFAAQGPAAEERSPQAAAAATW